MCVVHKIVLTKITCLQESVASPLQAVMDTVQSVESSTPRQGATVAQSTTRDAAVITDPNEFVAMTAVDEDTAICCLQRRWLD